MPLRSYPPPFLRYFKARLLNLRRPAFWLTAIFLLEVGVVAWQYLSRQGLLTQTEQKQQGTATVPDAANSSISEADQAIAADIDNLPVLLSDIERVPLTSTLTAFPDNEQAQKTSNFLARVTQTAKASTNQFKPLPNLDTANSVTVNNPLVTPAQNLLPGDQEVNGNQLQTATTTTSNNQNTVLVSPLETAIKQATPQNHYLYSHPLNSPGSSNNSAIPSTPINSAVPNQGVTANPNSGYIQPSLTQQPQNLHVNPHPMGTTPNQAIANTGVTSVNSYPANNPVGATSTGQTFVNPSPEVSKNSVNMGLQPSPYSSYTSQPPSQLPQSGNINFNTQQPNSLSESNISYPGQYPR
jgi:hypothetical protein